MSIRRQTSTVLDDRLLDAAAAVVARHGIRRTTMDDVARAAACSRPTVYKHFPSRDDLLAAMFVREVNHYLVALEGRLETASPAFAFEDAFVFTLHHVQRHPIVHGVLEADENGLLSVMALGDGRVLTVITEGVTPLLARFVTATDPRVVGEAFVRLVASFLLLPPLYVDPADDEAVRAFVRQAMVTGLGRS